MTERILKYGSLEALAKHDFWFYMSKREGFYHVLGNCFEVSNAFWFDTTDVNEIFALIEKWTPFPARLKQRIIQQIQSNDVVFASNPEAFEQAKVFCFKDYSQCKPGNQYRDVKISVLKGFNGDS